MADFDPVKRASEIDEVAHDCLKIPRNEEIERRECAQRLYTSVGSLTQKNAVDVGKVYERYTGRNPLPQSHSLGHEILFTTDTSPIVAGFKFTAADSYGSGYISLTAKLAPEQLKKAATD